MLMNPGVVLGKPPAAPLRLTLCFQAFLGLRSGEEVRATRGSCALGPGRCCHYKHLQPPSAAPLRGPTPLPCALPCAWALRGNR